MVASNVNKKKNNKEVLAIQINKTLDKTVSTTPDACKCRERELAGNSV